MFCMCTCSHALHVCGTIFVYTIASTGSEHSSPNQGDTLALLCSWKVATRIKAHMLHMIMFLKSNHNNQGIPALCVPEKQSYKEPHYYGQGVLEK